jgi:DNA recombination protein RmuC
MIEILLVLILMIAAVAALFAVLAFVAARRGPEIVPLSRVDAMELLRVEGDAIRNAGDLNARGLRQEVGQVLTQNQTGTIAAVATLSDSLLKQVDAFSARLEASNNTTEARIDGIGTKLNTDIEQMGQAATSNRESLRGMIEQKLDQSVAAHSEAARVLRDELNAGFQRMRQGVGDTLMQTSDQQKERLDATQSALRDLADRHVLTGEQLRQTVEGRLDMLRKENAAELEKVRETVDEKLNTTLNKRLDESFGRVVEQLNKAYEAFGEMKNISTDVGDLKNILTNPKLRGTFGEVQLEMLLQDFLSPGQYIKDAQVREQSAERVEFAIRLPMPSGEEMLLPVDAKFPREDHERMIQAMETGDVRLTEHFRKQLENRIKLFAKEISRKYINPPRTTERAILFLPTESLFAEVLRQPGLFETLHREHNVMLAGPTTFAAILHAFQINYRSMALAKQSSEVWKVLSAVRTEFSKYNDVVSRLGKQLNTAAVSVEEIGRRARAVDRTLKEVDRMPDDGSAARLLGLEQKLSDDIGEEDNLIPPHVLQAGSPIVVPNAGTTEGIDSPD